MSDDKKYVLSIDLGTSGPKAALVSSSGEIVSTGRAKVETTFLPGDGAEQDPDSVWQATKEACKTVMAAATVDPKAVLAVICSSQYSSVGPVDEAGQHTMNMIVWLDQRGSASRLRKLDSFPRRADNPAHLLIWLRIHGLPPVGSGS